MPGLETLLANLLSPPLLCFALGFVAYLLRSDLRLPDALTQTLSLYLLLAIGFKGGVAITADSSGFFSVLAVTLLLGFSIPLWVFFIGRKIGSLKTPEAASLGAHYGSTSAVTFLACLAFLDRNDIAYEGYMTAILAIMEIPALMVGILLVAINQRERLNREGFLGAIHHVLTGKSIVLLMGGMAIGLVADSEGVAAVEPFFVHPFLGVLCLFLLDLGRLTAEHIREVRKNLLFLIPFGIIAPIVHGILGVVMGGLAGLSPGGACILGIICGSASYIAAPAAMRVACPHANHALPLSISLGVTFPFNLAIGIPLLYSISVWLFA
ncbi:MAG: sodium-dependent bicarbonate transport family permease [Planctomycetota bacterium]|nr:MAG: sodium-dependent bicarbonate transport family permease [Planctomycetota bacterium]